MTHGVCRQMTRGTVNEQHDPGRVIESVDDTAHASSPLLEDTWRYSAFAPMPELERIPQPSVCGLYARRRRGVLCVLGQYDLWKEGLQLCAVCHHGQIRGFRIVPILRVTWPRAGVSATKSWAAYHAPPRILHRVQSSLVHVEYDVGPIPDDYLDDVAQPLQECPYLPLRYT